VGRILNLKAVSVGYVLIAIPNLQIILMISGHYRTNEKWLRNYLRCPVRKKMANNDKYPTPIKTKRFIYKSILILLIKW